MENLQDTAEYVPTLLDGGAGKSQSPRHGDKSQSPGYGDKRRLPQRYTTLVTNVGIWRIAA